PEPVARIAGRGVRVSLVVPRGVAQLGSALRSGRRGRGFKSRHPDKSRSRITRWSGTSHVSPEALARAERARRYTHPSTLRRVGVGSLSPTPRAPPPPPTPRAHRA